METGTLTPNKGQKCIEKKVLRTCGLTSHLPHLPTSFKHCDPKNNLSWLRPVLEWTLTTCNEEALTSWAGEMAQRQLSTKLDDLNFTWSTHMVEEENQLASTHMPSHMRTHIHAYIHIYTYIRTCMHVIFMCCLLLDYSDSSSLLQRALEKHLLKAN